MGNKGIIINIYKTTAVYIYIKQVKYMSCKRQQGKTPKYCPLKSKNLENKIKLTMY